MLDEGVSLNELSEQTGESPRTLRFYVMQGLLRGPEGAGSKARYPREHVSRVLWIRARQAEGLSLGRIARDLRALEAAGLPLTAAVASPPSAPPPPPAPAPPPPSSAAMDYLVAAGLLPRSAPAPLPAAAAPALVPPPPGEAPRSTWERVVLTEGVELHVRRPLDPATQRRVKQLSTYARETFRKPGDRMPIGGPARGPEEDS